MVLHIVVLFRQTILFQQFLYKRVFAYKEFFRRTCRRKNKMRLSAAKKLYFRFIDSLQPYKIVRFAVLEFGAVGKTSGMN